MTNGNKQVVIGGAGPGLGAELCSVLTGKGYRVITLSRSLEFTTGLAQRFSGNAGQIIPMACDLTDEKDVETVFRQLHTQIGPTHAYIHNPSNPLRRAFQDMHAREFEDLWRLTCYSALLCSRQVLPVMLAQGEGAVIFTGATASVRGNKEFSAFASAKFALRGLAQALAREYAPKGIHIVHSVIDGVMWPHRAEEFGMPRKACVDAGNVAEMYLQLIEQKRSAWTHELDIRPYTEAF